MTNPSLKQKHTNGIIVFFVGTLLLAAGMFFYNSNYAQYYIPSESMTNTLKVDDRVMIKKTDPVNVDIHRGDIIVFKDPGGWLNPNQMIDGKDFLIKRVIAVGGDTIECCDSNGNNILNGKSLSEPYLKNGNNLDFTQRTIPKGHVWVQGDNREESKDSRYNNDTQGGAYVPFENIQGKVVYLVWPFYRVTSF